MCIHVYVNNISERDLIVFFIFLVELIKHFAAWNANPRAQLQSSRMNSCWSQFTMRISLNWVFLFLSKRFLPQCCDCWALLWWNQEALNNDNVEVFPLSANLWLSVLYMHHLSIMSSMHRSGLKPSFVELLSTCCLKLWSSYICEEVLCRMLTELTSYWVGNKKNKLNWLCFLYGRLNYSLWERKSHCSCEPFFFRWGMEAIFDWIYLW